MKKRVIAGVMALAMGILMVTGAVADVIILKNGQVIHDVTIREEGETLVCETADQSFFIDSSAVRTIVRTGKKPFLEGAKAFIAELPDRLRRFGQDHFAVGAVLTGLLVLFAVLLIFKFLWVNIRPVMAGSGKKRRVIQAVKRLDAGEQSVLREFFLQGANTLEMPVEDVVVSGLIRKGVLQTTRDHGQYAVCGLMLPVTLSPVAAQRVRPETVGLPPDIHAGLDEHLRDELARSRPPFMYDLAEFYRSLEKHQRNFR